MSPLKPELRDAENRENVRKHYSVLIDAFRVQRARNILTYSFENSTRKLVNLEVRRRRQKERRRFSSSNRHFLRLDTDWLSYLGWSSSKFTLQTTVKIEKDNCLFTIIIQFLSCCLLATAALGISICALLARQPHTLSYIHSNANATCKPTTSLQDRVRCGTSIPDIPQLVAVAHQHV